LGFREKRRPELLALRHHLEQVYQRILNAGDGELALNSETESLERAIADHIKVSKASGLRFRPMTFSASINLIRGVAAAGITAFFDFPTLGQLAAGLAGGLSIGPSTALTWSKPTGTPYQYVSAYHEEVF
jgi:hypothetical protein